MRKDFVLKNFRIYSIHQQCNFTDYLINTLTYKHNELVSYDYLGLENNSKSEFLSILDGTLFILGTNSFLTPKPNSKSNGAIIKLIAIPVVADGEKLKVLKLTISSMISKNIASSTLRKSFLYGWIQM